MEAKELASRLRAAREAKLMSGGRKQGHIV